MKAVLISIQPKWCELIASGKKTVEVRKTKPKLEVPFKVYIYCTLQGSNDFFKELQERFGEYEALSKWNRENWGIRKGKVIGEFVCDKIYDITPYFDTPTFPNQYICGWGYGKEFDCLSFEELTAYLNGKQGYGWHISDLVIYDKPKELKQFQKPCIHEGYDCSGCEMAYWTWANGYEGCMLEEGLQRPPQSWCYVERSETR